VKASPATATVEAAAAATTTVEASPATAAMPTTSALREC
jgi:hypothetical protein